MKVNRTKRSIINLITAIIGQVFGVIISFIVRMIFVKNLSSEYLGVNGLFTNILTMLSLVDLGIGTAIIYSLYKPLAEDNKEKVKSLMDLYKKAYRTVGIIVLILGIGFTPFYKYLISEIPDIYNLNLIYILFVVNTGISYFYSYKRSLIICDQKRYIATIYRYGFYFLYNIAQIIVLITTGNYILYLICQVIATILENIAVSKKADKMYPYLKEKDIKSLPKEELNQIKKNVGAMFCHRIGGMVVNSTDNIILSKFVGLVLVGMYSNYYMVINGLELIINQIFDAIVASVGNLGASESIEKVKSVFKKVFFMNFWIFSFCSICLLVLFNNFIQIWVGQEYVFELSVVATIIAVFYLKGIRKTVLTFRHAIGIFYYDRYKPFFEAVINLIVSIVLAIKMGVTGVFLGTIISTIATSIWIEPYVLYKYVFKEKPYNYFIKLALYTLLTVVVSIFTYWIASFVKEVSILGIIIKLIICLIVPNIIYIILFIKTEELNYFTNLIKNIFGKIKKIKNN